MTHVWATTPNVTGRRAADDFYRTTPECVIALLPHIADFPGPIWEPACGDGSISKALIAVGRTVASTDLVSRGYAPGDGIDFLKMSCCLAPAIITNPPYGNGLAEKFIRKAFALGCTHLAFLLKANYFNAKRGGLFEQHPPSRILPLTWRVDFSGQGRPFLDCNWVVWCPGCNEARTIRLMRPGAPADALTPPGLRTLNSVRRRNVTGKN